MLQYPLHSGVQRWVGDLNRFYRDAPALYERDFTADGFAWIDNSDHESSVVAFLRRARNPEDVVVAVFNFTPLPRDNYRIGVPRGGMWAEVLNSDATPYGGSGRGNLGGVEASPLASHGHYHSLTLQLPPLGAVVLRPA